MATRKPVSLALQGGGAHGAFTWGVLDALLEDGRIEIEAMSGASAGAVNAALLIDGFEEGGAEGARRQLDLFWKSISSDGHWSSAQRRIVRHFMSGVIPQNVWSGLWFGWLSLFASPYDFNPLNLNPMRDVIDELINFERLRGCKRIRLAVSATNVRTGRIKVFDASELTADHIMASACLPLLFQAVQIGEDYYWDGGYMGNPALYPLFYGPKTDDILLVQINPKFREKIPRTAQEIHDRLNEITFNAALIGELRAVEFVQRLSDTGVLPKDKYKRVRMHRIDADEALAGFTAVSKYDANFEFLLKLKHAGKRAAKTWLENHFDDLGERETFPLREEINKAGDKSTPAKV